MPSSGISKLEVVWYPVPSDRPGEFSKDYAIIARCSKIAETGRMVVIAAGKAWGTAAAG